MYIYPFSVFGCLLRLEDNKMIIIFYERFFGKESYRNLMSLSRELFVKRAQISSHENVDFVTKKSAQSLFLISF